jgi:hypothetical protein
MTIIHQTEPRYRLSVMQEDMLLGIAFALLFGPPLMGVAVFWLFF